MVICASVCKPDTPGWWDLEPYSSGLRRTWAAGNIGRGHTSTWHFENPNPARRPNIHKYSKYSASIEIPAQVFFEPLSPFTFLRFQRSEHPTSWDFSKAETLSPHCEKHPAD